MTIGAGEIATPLRRLAMTPGYAEARSRYPEGKHDRGPAEHRSGGGLPGSNLPRKQEKSSKKSHPMT